MNICKIKSRLHCLAFSISLTRSDDDFVEKRHNNIGEDNSS